MANRDKIPNMRQEKVEYYRAKMDQVKNPRTFSERMMLQMCKDMLKKYEAT